MKTEEWNPGDTARCKSERESGLDPEVIPQKPVFMKRKRKTPNESLWCMWKLYVKIRIMKHHTTTLHIEGKLTLYMNNL